MESLQWSRRVIGGKSDRRCLTIRKRLLDFTTLPLSTARLSGDSKATVNQSITAESMAELKSNAPPVQLYVAYGRDDDLLQAAGFTNCKTG